MTPDIDLIIIGAGAGGSTAAYAAAKRGIKVLVLEAGPRFSTTDYQLHKPDWERSRFPEKPGSQGQYSFAPMQTLEARWASLRSWNTVAGFYNTNDHRIPSGQGYHHVRGVGGSTLAFTGESHRFNPQSMRMQSRFGVAADWPLDYAALAPFYQQAERIIGVAGHKSPASRGFLGDHILPEHPFCPTSQFIKQSPRLQWESNQRAALSIPYQGRPACNYCNNCNRGCPRGDKGSADITFMRAAEQTGLVQIITGVQVTQLETDHDRTITGVVYADAHHVQHRVKAQRVILAAGAVETPRLLLNNASANSPEGLGNESGHVGKHFMETLTCSISAIAEQPLASYKGLPSDIIAWDYNAPDSIPDVIGGCRFSSTLAENDLVGPINLAQRLIPGWGSDLKRAVHTQFGSVVSLGAIGESLPNPNSYITLDAQQKDALGLPIARIHSYLDEHELKRLDFMLTTCKAVFSDLGLTEIREQVTSYDLFAATHAFGTCRMGIKETESVTNPWGVSHRWNNLMIADTSLFPSSGGGESPSLTLQALVLRNIEHWFR